MTEAEIKDALVMLGEAFLACSASIDALERDNDALVACIKGLTAGCTILAKQIDTLEKRIKTLESRRIDYTPSPN